MKNKIDWESVINYLDEVHTEEEEQKINEWLRSSPKNQKEFARLKKIWDAPDTRLPEPDIEKAWMTVMDKAGIERKTREAKTNRILRFEPQRRKFLSVLSNPGILKTAAVLFLIIMLPFLVIHMQKMISIQKVVVGTGDQKLLTLADGTRVALDAGSIFKYPVKFGKNDREVTLNGEGYFEVAEDSQRPFAVRANDAVITVLGTKFNVRAWRRNRTVIVAVADGVVSLHPKKINSEDANVVISKNQMSLLKKKEMPSEPQNTDISKHIVWRHREMYFQSVPLRQVLDQLERWYNLDIKISDKSFESNLVTIFIENRPIEEILDVISLTNRFKYTRDGNTIIFESE